MLRSFQLLCCLGEYGQSRTPEPLERMQPLTQLCQRFCGQAVDAPAALRLVGHQPGVTQHLEVLGDGGATELEPIAEFPGGQWLPGEDLKQFPPHRVSQAAKTSQMRSHPEVVTIGNICRRNPTCQLSPTRIMPRHSGPELPTNHARRDRNGTPS